MPVAQAHKYFKQLIYGVVSSFPCSFFYIKNLYFHFAHLKYVFMQYKGTSGLDSVSIEHLVKTSQKSDQLPRCGKLIKVQEAISFVSKQRSVKICQTRSFKAMRHKRATLNNQLNSE